MKEPRFCITAINRMTRQRESVTRPYTKETAEKMLRREKDKPPAKRSWIYPRMEAVEPQQLTINFKTE
jgi:hypothetical protein